MTELVHGMRARLIPILLLDRNRRLVKTVRFGERTYIGDPFNVVRIFNEKEVDELCVLDIDATPDGRGPDIAFAEALASECFMPLAYGGGITTPAQCHDLNKAGIEKFVIGTGIDDRDLMRSIAATFGVQALVACVDVRDTPQGRTCHVRSGTRSLSVAPVDLARRAADDGAGEILLQSIDRDGLRSGMDLDTIGEVSAGVDVPVIAAGGAGTVEHLNAALGAGASAAASGSTFCFVGRLRAVLISYPTSDETGRRPAT